MACVFDISPMTCFPYQNNLFHYFQIRTCIPYISIYLIHNITYHIISYHILYISYIIYHSSYLNISSHIPYFIYHISYTICIYIYNFCHIPSHILHLVRYHVPIRQVLSLRLVNAALTFFLIAFLEPSVARKKWCLGWGVFPSWI